VNDGPIAQAIVPEKDVLGVFAYTIDLTGDIPTGFSCFVLPCVLYLTAMTKKSNIWLWYAAHAFLVMGCILVCLCPITDTIQFVRACISDAGCSAY
jgi:hypothetical protein